jgi:hypothetical protein
MSLQIHSNLWLEVMPTLKVVEVSIGEELPETVHLDMGIVASARALSDGASASEDSNESPVFHGLQRVLVPRVLFRPLLHRFRRLVQPFSFSLIASIDAVMCFRALVSYAFFQLK